MAKKREDVSYEESKSTSSLEDNEEYEDLRVVAVIENKDATTKKANETTLNETQFSKASSDNEREFDQKPEVILLDEAPISRTSGNAYDTRINKKLNNNPRVIELSDDKSKMELRREFKVDVANPELSVGDRRDSRNSPDDEDDDYDGSADILSRLPPGTILIKQSARCEVPMAGTSRDCAPDDSDYVHDSSKDSTGTNSSESSTASYNASGKVRRMQYRSVRSKKVVEVRRNPVRNKKKKPIDEDFTRPRQRLLAVKRTSNFVVDNPSRKRSRTAPTPYMNTISVTRKMYTVGATYQAPTANDALEWKEWPSHGMHERPIWHPQVGLAYEYNERSFVTLDGETYREIIEEPVIEVVSVDPNPERMAISHGQSFAHGRRNMERTRYYNPSRSLELVDKRESFVRDNSFQTCMHGSFHSVLAYCARVVTPSYRRNVDLKIRAYSRSDEASENSKLPMKVPELGKFSQVAGNAKMAPLLVPATAGASSTSLTKTPETFSNIGNSNELPKCLVIPRKTIHFTNVRNIQGNILQEVFNRSSKNTLIFLKPTDPPGKAAEKIAAALNNSSIAKSNPTKSKDGPSTSNPKLTKLDDNAISDEALMEMSSMYNGILPSDEIDNVCPKSFKPTSYLTRPVTALVATKIPIKSSNDSPMDNPSCANPRPSCSGIRNANVRASIKERTNDTPRFAYSNQAAEIAKILAEYNQKAARNSPTGMRNYADVLNVRTMPGAKTVKTVESCPNGPNSRNTFLSFVEHPRNIRIKREQDIQETMNPRSFNVDRQSSAGNPRTPSATITSGSDVETNKPLEPANDDVQAMDLTTAKPRDSKDETKVEVKTEEPRKWLQELIEDSAILYCAAGVQNGDANEYMNTLDSVQNMQWLGS